MIHQLIDNAIKFSKKESLIEVSLINHPEIITFQIIDNGIGIPENRLHEIFEPFHQLDSSSTRKAGGVGLGLALAKKIIESHGSTLNAVSKEDIGSTFDFSLKKLIK